MTGSDWVGTRRIAITITVARAVTGAICCAISRAEAFPGAEVTAVRSVADAEAGPAEPEGLAPAPDEFEDFDPEETDEDFI